SKARHLSLRLYQQQSNESARRPAALMGGPKKRARCELADWRNAWRRHAPAWKAAARHAQPARCRARSRARRADRCLWGSDWKALALLTLVQRQLRMSGFSDWRQESSTSALP